MYVEEALLLVTAHYVSDFLAQSQWMAEEKSKSNFVLTAHIYVLSFVLCLFFWLGPCAVWTLPGFSIGAMTVLTLVAVNGATHWVIDYFSSRAMRKAWEEGRVRTFFKILGLDQALHVGILFSSYIVARDLGGVVFG